MNKLFTICLSLLFVASSAFASVTSHFVSRNAISTPEMRKQANWGLAGQSQQLRQQKMLTEIGIPTDTTISIDYSQTRYFLIAPDGSDWICLPNSRTTSGGDYRNVTYDFYDGKQNHKGSFTIEIPKDKIINMIEPFGTITNKFFDNNENTYEVLVYMHEVLAPGVVDNHIYVYNTQGDSVAYFHSSQAAFMQTQKDAYTRYERLILVGTTDSIIGYTDTNEPIKKTYQRVDFYKPKGWSETNEIEKTMFFEDDLVRQDLLVGPWLNIYTIDNKAYYCVSSYEKPYYTGEWDYSIAYQYTTPNNRFKLQLYDETYQLINEISFPCEDMGTSAYKTYGLGTLTYNDLSKGFFTGDDQWNYLITADTYDFQADESKLDFFVYDSKGNLIKTIDTNVDYEGVKVLSDIEGYERQVAFGHTETSQEDEITNYIKVINIPSCEVVATLSPTSEAPVSFVFDRTAKKGGGYEYAISYTQPEMDAYDSIYAVIGWFDEHFKFDRKVLFNIGTDGLIANPLLNASSLNPYLINTNDEHEYIYLWSTPKNNNTEEKHWHLCIADHEGKPIVDYIGNPSKGDLLEPGIMNAGTSDATLYVLYHDDGRNRSHIEYIPLPLTKFERGGKGTAAEPYLVASRGDLEQVANAPRAHYKQVEDIDMNACGRSWKAIADFAGKYDGDNHILSNLTINPDGGDYLGLFSFMSDSATVCNLRFNNPVINVGEFNAKAGVLVADASNAVKISNVHISNGKISSDSETAATIGGIAGTVTFNSAISACSFNGEIAVEGAYPVGGIAGNIGTTSPIDVCAFSGSITANSGIGGIVGEQGDKSPVTNCHVIGNLEGQHTIGGIIGTSIDRSGVTNNIAEVELTSLSSDWDANVGGIIGDLGGDYTKAGTKIIKNNVAVIEDITCSSSQDGSTIHGIIGKSIENTELEPGDEPYYELGLTNNYINKQISVGETALTFAHDNINGEVVATEAMNKAFFEKLGYVYGNDVTAPWVDGTLPSLYIEQLNGSGIENIETESNSETLVRKVLHNGTIYIIRGEDIYLIDGRKL